MIYDRQTLEMSIKHNKNKLESYNNFQLGYINLETFGLKLKDQKNSESIKVSVSDIISLKERINSVLEYVGHTMSELHTYHKESENYWLNDIDEEENYEVGDEEEKFRYSCTIACNEALRFKYKDIDGTEKVDNDLDFQLYSMDKIYKRLIKDFFKAYPKEKPNYDFHYYRSDLSGYSKTFESTQKFYKWVDEHIVQPYVQYLLEDNNISEVTLTKKQIGFEYSKTDPTDK